MFVAVAIRIHPRADGKSSLKSGGRK